MKVTVVLFKIVACGIALFIPPVAVNAFHIPHPRHQHPHYVRYRQEQLEQHHSQTPSPSDIVRTQGTSVAISEEEYNTSFERDDSFVVQKQTSNAFPFETEVSISTPVTYDEETGMVQTAVRAIVQHPLSKHLADNSMVGLSSTIVLTTGAFHEVVHSLELEWMMHHHAAVASGGSSPEGLGILSLGHFFHYGREAIRQLVELHEEEEEEEDRDETEE